MIITNGYPVETPSGAVWIVTVDENVILREATVPDVTYVMDDEDDAVTVIEDGTVDDETWRVEHDPTYYGVW
jgi:hypothetical protein